ncbi:hypothetical protein AGOR_G00132630 [Albula goreensis]|uniref:Uncharacterized protein n=1 Tax=Albula goreensis TaxID=1534307 RepID=A0A8T3D9W5_9TELE|nr:hypothetical protein AGOR_G00132630 [Albula goreensis]
MSQTQSACQSRLMNSMAKHKLLPPLPVLLLASLLLLLPPPLPCDLVPAVPEESSETPASDPVGIRGDAEASEERGIPQEGDSPPATPHPLIRNLQPHGWSHAQDPPRAKRKLLQTGSALFAPLTVVHNNRPCILFRARKLAVRYRNYTTVDLTERTFGPAATVDTKDSVCSKDSATLSLNYGDVENLKGLVIRLEMSKTFYESAGQTWFTLDSVQIHYNCELEATFNAPEVYAPTTHSYHCQHVSSLQKYDTLLVPSAQSDSAHSESTSTDGSANWHITFTDFQIQAFNVQSGHFASARDCAALLTPAVLMGLVTSLILLLVLAYALHMVVHLKHIDRYEEHKTTVYFPRSPDVDRTDKNGS